MPFEIRVDTLQQDGFDARSSGVRSIARSDSPDGHLPSAGVVGFFSILGITSIALLSCSQTSLRRATVSIHKQLEPMHNRSRIARTATFPYYFSFHFSFQDDRKCNVRFVVVSDGKQNITRPVEPCALSARILDPLDTLGPSRVARSEERKKKGKKGSIDRQIYAREGEEGKKKKGGRVGETRSRTEEERAEEVLTW